MKEKSFGLEILSDYKKQNKRIFIIWLITFMALISSIIYIIYLYNDIGTIKKTQDIQGIETIENSDITNGDMYGENKTNNHN
jgi:hypothetical protein